MNYNKNNPTTAQLSHESLDVYQLSLKFHLGVMTLLPQRGSPTLRDQLERASISIILNIAEGSGRRSPADRRRHFVIAQGSTYELVAYGHVPPSSTSSASVKSLNPPVVSMPATTRYALHKCYPASVVRPRTMTHGA